MGFDWDVYPGTRDYVDGSGITKITAAETNEFRALYHVACKIYKMEGGQGELGKQNVKVLPICSSSDK
jgi:hypothetical protein